MAKRIGGSILIIIISVWCDFALFGMESTHMPPARVTVSEISFGAIVPEAEFVGTVYYPQISDVAAEVSGKVDIVNFEEGDRVKKGQILAKINADLLRKNIKTKKALHEQILSDLGLARRDLKRTENLYREEAVAEQVYDENRFRVSGLEKKSASIKAEREGLMVEFQKKVVRAPFDGVILKKLIDDGEWLSPGTPVATIARDDEVDVIFNVPEDVLTHTPVGKSITIKAAGLELPGKVFAIIPQGDIPTRTFPVKIRIRNLASLTAGMEAKTMLPKGKEIKTLIIKRDAIINMFGETVVFACVDLQTKMIPVRVTGYSGMMAGIEAPELEEGMKIVVKGNERLIDGQMVEILGSDNGSLTDK
ncbi:MAG: efflux RND transporter periplasmic adaptor subunit [Candidatus Brocadiaceae bacterium]|nr:efflux RND transporter periplasmic adaptor subunit [Candidatus Brocadiaceae bacterium]